MKKPMPAPMIISRVNAAPVWTGARTGATES
jgi:hypothetical protein